VFTLKRRLQCIDFKGSRTAEINIIEFSWVSFVCLESQDYSVRLYDMSIMIYLLLISLMNNLPVLFIAGFWRASVRCRVEFECRQLVVAVRKHFCERACAMVLSSGGWKKGWSNWWICQVCYFSSTFVQFVINSSLSLLAKRAGWCLVCTPEQVN